MNVVLPIDPVARADERQRAASDPLVSTFVAASAGSGKTKLLTDRLLRLMLADAEPARIVCLTYTRAGAAEMALRLRDRLGRWVALPDDLLSRELLSLEVDPTETARARARALFATVLDLPGGLRIGTIHAFCQSLLGRFPLEAGLSPRFALLDEADGRVAQTDALEAVLARDVPMLHGAIEHVSKHKKLDDIRRLMEALLGKRDRLTAIAGMPAEALRVRQGAMLGAGDRDILLDAAVAVPADVLAASRLLADTGNGYSRPLAQERLRWFALPHAARRAGWSSYLETFVKDDGDPRAGTRLCDAPFRKRHPDLAAACDAEQDRVIGLANSFAAIDVLELSDGLARLVLPALATFAERKRLTARLDYADLIERTVALLRDADQAAWVLHKLDGGIDHLLLDEVQDTAPEQWRIAAALTQDFFVGDGAREHAPVPRSVFAVGDPKQSIFSFQGADPAGFDREHDAFRRRVRDGGAQWAEVALDVSFRSTAPVLALVDAVFAEEAPGPTHHISSRPGQAGSVEQWTLEPSPPKDDPMPYHVPRQRQTATSARQALVDKLADRIQAETDGSVMLESHARPLRPGDVLVLVRNRDDLPSALIRALKQRGVPVAGLDQMRLTEQPAVADLLALCDALLLPSDDLAVGCVLTSPLGGLSDDDLMTLAMTRGDVTLWEALRDRAHERPAWGQAWSMMAALFARVDYVTPHALLTEALGVHGGQARLLRRLGAEAADPIAELLAATLTYAGSHPPSLQGFVHWLRRSAATVKREPHGAGDLVRVMTVHGAKGLQAPLVILPDTTFTPKGAPRLLWADDGTGLRVPLWSPAKHTTCPAFETLHAAENAADLAENRRLLYVALTRAEDRLIVCGKQNGKNPEPAPGSWYAMIAAGLARLGASASCPQTAKPDRPTRPSDAPTPAALPAWAGAAPDWRPKPPPEEPALPARLAPSRPEGAGLGTVPASASPLAARSSDQRFARGRLIHKLLQHLPELPPDRREAAAMRLLAGPAAALDPPAQVAMWREVAAVLEHPALASAFGPGSRAEVPLSGVVGGVVVGGLVDRLAVGPDTVLIVDYKTNRLPPPDPAETPVMYLRQMAAYRALLQAIHPALPVVCALVWTATGTVAVLSPTLLDTHAPLA